MFVLWANLHGGFFVGLAVLAVYTAVIAIEDFVAGNAPGRATRLGGVTAGCVIATLLNPDGIGNWLTVMRTMRNPLTRAAISEWQPSLFKIAEQWHESPGTALNFAVVIALPLALAVCFVIRPRGDDLALVAVAALMALGAWLSVRNMALAVIVGGAPMPPRRTGARASAFRRSGGGRAAPGLHDAILVGALALLIVLQSGLFSRTLRDGIPNWARSISCRPISSRQSAGSLQLG